MTNQNVGGKREGRGRKHARFLLAGNCMVGTPGTETGNTLEGLSVGRGVCAALATVGHWELRCLGGSWKYYLMRDNC